MDADLSTPAPAPAPAATDSASGAVKPDQDFTSDTAIRVRADCERLNLQSARLVRVPSGYYDLPIEERQAILGAASIDHLCKSILMEVCLAVNPKRSNAAEPTRSHACVACMTIVAIHIPIDVYGLHLRLELVGPCQRLHRSIAFQVLHCHRAVHCQAVQPRHVPLGSRSEEPTQPSKALPLPCCQCTGTVHCVQCKQLPFCTLMM
jgi:hypothetical protein